MCLKIYFTAEHLGNVMRGAVGDVLVLGNTNVNRAQWAVLDVAVGVVGVVEGAVGGGRGALYQLVCHDCSPAGWNFDISYSPSITKVRVNIFWISWNFYVSQLVVKIIK